MRVFDSATLIALAISIGLFLSVVRFIIRTKGENNSTYGALLIQMIKAPKYYKDVMPNDYPEYPGAVEEKDTKEYVSYLQSGILERICNKKAE